MVFPEQSDEEDDEEDDLGHEEDDDEEEEVGQDEDEDEEEDLVVEEDPPSISTLPPSLKDTVFTDHPFWQLEHHDDHPFS